MEKSPVSAGLPYASCRRQTPEHVRDHWQETVACIEQFVAREIFVDGETPIRALATFNSEARDVFKYSRDSCNRGGFCSELRVGNDIRCR